METLKLEISGMQQYEDLFPLACIILPSLHHPLNSTLLHHKIGKSICRGQDKILLEDCLNRISYSRVSFPNKYPSDLWF